MSNFGGKRNTANGTLWINTILKALRPVRFPGRRMPVSQNGRHSWLCAIAGNFDFRGESGLSDPDFLGAFGTMPKRTMENKFETGSGRYELN
jgi:hypothetical protein